MFRKEGWHEKMHLIKSEVDMPDDMVDDMVITEQAEVEDPKTHKMEKKKYKMEIKGLFNIIFLAGVIGGVLFSGQVQAW